MPFFYLLAPLFLTGALCEHACLLQARVGVDVEAWNPIAELPDELRKIGTELFSSMDGVDFDEFVRGTSRPHKVDLGHGRSIVLVRQRQEELNNPWIDIRRDTKKDDYGILGDKGIAGGVVVDIGSNIGTQAIMAAKFHHEVQVIALEPLPTTFFYLLWNMHLNGVRALDESDLLEGRRSGILPLNMAATGDGRTVRIVLPKGGYDSEQVSASMIQKRGEHVDVQSMAIPHLLHKYKIDSVKLFKIDCEGCEHEVLPAIADHYICDESRFQRIEGELHFANAQKLSQTSRVLASCGCPIIGNIVAKGDNAMFSCSRDRKQEQ